MKKPFVNSLVCLALLSCLAGEALAADNVIRVMAPIRESQSGGWLDATSYTEWASGSSTCVWTPSSDSVAANAQLTQTGSCGIQQSRTVTPLERNSKTGEVRSSGEATVETRIQDAQAQTRVVYGDIYSPINAVATYTNQYYVGMRPGEYGTTSTVAGGIVPYVFFVKGSGNSYLAFAGVTASSFGKVGEILARYSVADLIDEQGSVISSFTISGGVSGGPGGNGYVRLSQLGGGMSVPDMFNSWYPSPAKVKAFRFHN